MARILQTIGLLVISNTFMTIAWYGHLKHKSSPLLIAILVSWSVAFFEYLFQVPANRIGSGQLSLTQLKVLQECITLVVFTIYALLVYQERLRWNNVVSMLLITAAVYFAFQGGIGRQAPKAAPASPAEGAAER